MRKKKRLEITEKWKNQRKRKRKEMQRIKGKFSIVITIIND